MQKNVRFCNTFHVKNYLIYQYVKKPAKLRKRKKDAEGRVFYAPATEGGRGRSDGYRRRCRRQGGYFKDTSFEREEWILRCAQNDGNKRRNEVQKNTQVGG